MRVLLFGKKGQVGVEIEKQFSDFGSLIALDRSSTDFCGDLAELKKIDETISLVKPTCIINAAAFTSVDDAEKERDLAMRINAYGKSKLMGEKYILDSDCHYLIFRTSWVHSVTGQNFIKTIIRLGEKNTKLSVVADQIGSPTSAALIANVTRKCVEMCLTDHEKGGIYNLTSLGVTNRLEYARLIVSVTKKLGVSMKLSPDAISGISSAEHKTAAARPLNSRLSTAKLERNFGIKLPVWNDDVTDTVSNLLSSRGQI